MTILDDPDAIVVVTGGAGFIGSNIAAQLAKGRARVVVCDRFGETEKWRNLNGVPIADIIRPEALLDYLARHASRVALIVHMGAISSTTERDVDRIVRDNLRMTIDLWAWCCANQTRFIYASSAATYGDGERGFDDTDDPAALSTLRPLNAYGWSKAQADLRITRDAHERGIKPPQWAGLKFFNVYGPGEDHKGDMRSVVNKIYPQVVRGEPVRLFRSYRQEFADGGQSRDFVYVKDCVAVVEGLIENNASGIFNVGSGLARSFSDLATATFTAAGREPRIEFIEMPEAIRAQYQYYTQANMAKAQRLGLLAAPHSLENGVADYVRFLKARAHPGA